MLSTGLQRARHDIQIHRQWLRAFVSKAYSDISTRSFTSYHTDGRPGIRAVTKQHQRSSGQAHYATQPVKDQEPLVTDSFKKHVAKDESGNDDGEKQPLLFKKRRSGAFRRISVDDTSNNQKYRRRSKKLASESIIKKHMSGGKVRRHAAAKDSYEPQQAPPAVIQERDELRQAVGDLRIRDVIKMYDALQDKSVFNRHDFRFIAQCLHYCYRSEERSGNARERRDQLDELVAFGEKLVRDVKQGVLMPNAQAHMHLLSFFKESGIREPGVQFWRWLEVQDDTFVTVDVYGAAIELLAFNDTALPQLEDLYQQALVRFPGNFAAYHLSNDAVVPDREKAVYLPGLPISLLQGIVTARLLHGDARNAYLALDTALRLLPDQVPPRFFTLFLEERPVFEAYTVFALACRAGIQYASNPFRKLQHALRSISDLESPVRHSIAVRSQLAALYLYSGAGGRLTQNIISEVIITITQFVRLLPSDTDSSTKEEVVNEVVAAIRQAITAFARFGLTPNLPAFSCIITNVGGFGGSKATIDSALADLRALRLRPNEATHVSVLAAAGRLRDQGFVAKSWQDLLQFRRHSAQVMDVTDWLCFVSAAHAADCIQFAKDEFESRIDSIPEVNRAGLLAALEEKKELSVSAEFSDSDIDSIESILDELKKISADLSVIEERTANQPRLQDFSAQDIPMTLLPPINMIVVPEQEKRKLYDELTTEESAPEPPNEEGDLLGPKVTEHTLDSAASSQTPPASDSDSTPSLTPTEIPFGVVRYENWKTMNWLLGQSEENDRVYHQQVDEAIVAGKAPPRRTAGWTFETTDGLSSYGLSDAHLEREAENAQSVGEEGIKYWKEHVLRLRGRTE
jgi:hypothetical protein